MALAPNTLDRTSRMSRRLEVTQLTPTSFRQSPVWEYTNDDETSDSGEIAVRPVLERRLGDTRNRLLGVDVRLADGTVVPAMLSNLDPRDANDATGIVEGNPAVLRGEIVAEPTERLSRAELIARAARPG